MAKLDRCQLIQGRLSDFLWLWLLKAQKKFVFPKDSVVQNFVKAEVKQIRKQKLKATYTVALVTVFLAAESENRQLEDLPRADIGRVYETISSFAKEKVNNW